MSATERAADEVVNAISAAGGKAKAIQGDVAVEADVISVFERAAAELGKLDGVVVNAGIVAPASPLIDMDIERMRRIFDINILGAYLCAREGVSPPCPFARRQWRVDCYPVIGSCTARRPE